MSIELGLGSINWINQCPAGVGLPPGLRPPAARPASSVTLRLRASGTWTEIK